MMGANRDRIALAAALLMAFLAGLAEFNTVLNDLFQTGSVVFDATLFGTVIWRSGWALRMAPLLENNSFYDTHVSPIMYLPDLLSYIFPGDRTVFFALVYAAAYAGTVFVVCRLVLPLVEGRLAPLWAMAASFLFFCSQPVFAAAFEPHMEVASPVFGMLMFAAWQKRRYGWAALWLVLNAAIREDIGAIFGLALMVFAAAQYFELKKSDPPFAGERLRQGVLLFAFGVTLTLGAFALQCSVSRPLRLFHELYFPSKDTFGHLDAKVMMHRLDDLWQLRKGIWLPLVALLVAGIALKDWVLFAGAAGFLPYFFINFISKDGYSATMTAYKPFPFIVAMLMPALVAILHPERRRRYALVQVAVLLAATVTYAPKQIYIARDRWLPHEYTYHWDAYREFGRQLPDLAKDGWLRADAGVEAIYPYDLSAWHHTETDLIQQRNMDKIRTLVWFGTPTYGPQIKEMLACYSFVVSDVPGTKIHVARRVQ